MRRIFSAIALAFLIYNFSVSSIRATTYSYVGQTLSGFLTSGPERPDAVKGDQRSPDAMDLRSPILASPSPASCSTAGRSGEPTLPGHMAEREPARASRSHK
jgi:hypothetical protein